MIRILLRAAGAGNLPRDALITLALGLAGYALAYFLFSIPD